MIALSKVKVPLPVIFGKYELLTDEELTNLNQDLIVEFQRRHPAVFKDAS